MLDRVEDILSSDRAEFLLYQAQQDCPISQKECTTDMPGGWDLDKYKFLNMILRTWEMRPGMKWYVFVEADTYIVWSNLIQWLNTRMDATEDIYVGGIAFLNNLPFAHGGTGYAISGVLLERLVAHIKEVPAKELNEMAMHTCCGDALLADVIDKLHVSVLRASPMFNGEKPNTLPFSPRDWCQPLFTLHHMNSEEISGVWQYEQTRTKTDPMQLRDIYHAFVAPNMVPRRPQWNNLADQHCMEKPEDGGDNVIEKHAHESAEACARVCLAEGLAVDAEAYEKLKTDDERDWYLQQRYRRQAPTNKGSSTSKNRRCFSWRYREGKCCTSDSFRLGYPVAAKKEPDATSGWFVDGINRWIQEHGQCSSGTDWVTPTCVGKWCPAEMEKQLKQMAVDEKRKAEMLKKFELEMAKPAKEGDDGLR